MSIWTRSALALAVVVLDLVAFAVPLAAIGFAYVLLARPPAFRDWIERLYQDP